MGQFKLLPAALKEAALVHPHHQLRTALVTLVATLNLAAGPDVSQAAPQTLKVLQWNVCGAVCNDGSGQPIDRLVDEIIRLQPQVVSLNEICHTQAKFLHSELEANGIAMNWHFGRASAVMLPNPLGPDCNGTIGADRFAGNAIFTTAPISAAKDYWFSGTSIVESRTTETRGFTCVYAAFTRSVHVCSLHVDPSDSIALAQIQAIVTKFSAGIQNEPTMLIGDFNVKPDQLLDIMYSSGLGDPGDFWEPDMWSFPPTPTHSEGKLDYIFFNEGFFDVPLGGDGQAIDGGTYGEHPCSDHKMLYGPARLLEGAAAATKYYVDTFATASGYLGTHCLNDPSQYCRPQGELYAGTNYVFCKRWGDEVSNGKDYNHWWMLTDLDEVYPGKSGRAYVSAYYLSRWGNDEAKDNNGIDLGLWGAMEQ